MPSWMAPFSADEVVWNTITARQNGEISRALSNLSTTFSLSLFLSLCVTFYSVCMCVSVCVFSLCAQIVAPESQT